MKTYRVSWYPIIAFMIAGIILLLLPFWDVKGFLSKLFFFFCILFLSFLFLGYSFYLFIKRKQGKSFYWDDEGITIDLNGNKVYWSEIEDIKFFKSSVTNMRSTVIYPHYTAHEKVRIRHKRLMPTTVHSIDWYLIENPKEYHKQLMNVWKEKQEKKTIK